MALMKRRRAAKVVPAGFRPCSVSKMGRSRRCTEGERTLVKKLIGEGKTYKEVQKIIGCSAKMISNALKWQTKPETRGRKRNTTIRIDHRITRMTKKHPVISSREIKEDLQV